MISEGSRDAEVMMLKIQRCITGINYILYILMKKNKKKTLILNCNNISQYYCILDPINVSLVNMESLKKQKTKITLIDPKIYIFF